MFDGEIIKEQILLFNLNCNLEKNQLTFVHYGKRFGEDNLWDTAIDASQDCKIKINDIQFDEITIGQELLDRLDFKTDWTPNQSTSMTKTELDNNSVISPGMGIMNYNGKIHIEFALPIMNWLIISKYKKPLDDSAYFSNFTARWHYDKDIEIIDEIERLINIT